MVEDAVVGLGDWVRGWIEDCGARLRNVGRRGKESDTSTGILKFVKG